MRFFTACTVSTVSVLLASTGVLAQEEDRNYEASISLGYVSTSGNTDTTTFNTEALYSVSYDRWTHTLKLQGLGSQENSATKAERYYLEDKSDYSLEDDQYLFLKGSYTDDRFSGFDYQAAVSGGYGRYLFRRDTLELQGYTGVGYRQNDLVTTGTQSEAILTLGEDFSWDISDNASLTQSFSTEIGQDRTVSKFEIGLESNIINHVATKISFQARNNSEVPAGRKKTDTLTSVSLVYTF